MYTYTYSIWRCHCIKYQDVEPSAIYLNENNFSKQNFLFCHGRKQYYCSQRLFWDFAVCNLEEPAQKLVHSMLESTSVCIINIDMPTLLIFPSDTEEMEIDKPRTYQAIFRQAHDFCVRWVSYFLFFLLHIFVLLKNNIMSYLSMFLDPFQDPVSVRAPRGKTVTRNVSPPMHLNLTEES